MKPDEPVDASERSALPVGYPTSPNAGTGQPPAWGWAIESSPTAPLVESSPRWLSDADVDNFKERARRRYGV